MLLRKCVYPYEYMDSWEKFDETTLPPKEAFYSNLNLEDISNEDYAHAEKVWDLHKYELDPVYFVSAPGLAWQACLKKTGVKLELLTDYDMILMIEKGIRGGICQATHRYAKVNNKYMKNYDKNIDSVYIEYLDANNLYGWAMSQKLPVNGFKWIKQKKLSKFNEDFIKNYDENSNKGYFLEVNIDYPK